MTGSLADGCDRDSDHLRDRGLRVLNHGLQGSNMSLESLTAGIGQCHPNSSATIGYGPLNGDVSGFFERRELL